MKTIQSMAITLALAFASFSAFAGDGVEVQHLGVNNTLVRVTGDGNYLLLPVQESNDDARINVLANGKIDKTIYVRLAKSKVDYYVPLNLSEYNNVDLLLDIVTPQGRNSVREAKDDACWKNITVSNSFHTANREKYRPAYHHTPQWGWMNDPNGMFYKDGTWHLYYQWNPYGSKWQNMTWGHSSSKDLVNWEHHPAAIEPNGLGSVFSGSSAVAPNDSNKVWAMYTSAGTSQMQSLAWSNDNGETFTINPANPVLTLESEARDPNFFWDAENNQWVLVLAHALDHEMLIFTSPDLKQWTQQSAFGKGLGAQDGVWECPDLFKLTAPDGTEKWVLLVNLNPGGPFGGSATQYFIGEFDGKTFKADDTDTRWLDYGKDHYATVSWSDAPDNRRTVIGWMSNWQYANEVPTMQYRSANTLPREMKLFTGADGKYYVASEPSPEVLALRGKLVKKASFTASKNPRNFAIPDLCEIILDIDAKASTDITLSNTKGEKVVMTYNPADRTMNVDRRESGLTDFSQDFPAVTVSPTFEKNGKVQLRLFIDRSSIELFGNNGQFTQTNLVFPTEPYSTLSVSSDGKAKVSNLQIYSINANN